MDTNDKNNVNITYNDNTNIAIEYLNSTLKHIPTISACEYVIPRAGLVRPVGIVASLTLIHINTRSLNKNLDKLETELIRELASTPDIIAITETKLNSSNENQVNLKNFNFINVNSKTRAGGVGCYLNKNIVYKIRNDIDFKTDYCETLWVELQNEIYQNIVIGIIYRHPNNNFIEFQDNLEANLIKLQNENKTYYICGDLNINLLKIKTNNIINYFHLINSLGTKNIITKPTRVTHNSEPSLLDHIYTNNTKTSVKPSIILSDISDHYPISAVINTGITPNCQKLNKKIRKFSNINIELFCSEMQQLLSTHNFNDSCPNKSMEVIIETYTQLIDIHAPLTTLSRKLKKIIQKPWLTKGILKSIKTKNLLYKKYCRCQNYNLFIKYKNYNNILTRIKER